MYSAASFDSPASQEKILVEEMLYALLSVDGQIIRKKPNSTNSIYRYYVDSSYGLNLSLLSIVEKMLPLCQYHDKIVVFINKYQNF